MNSAPNPLPGLQSLYWMDFTIQRAVLPGALGLMLAAGMWWMTRPIPNAGPQGEVTPEVEYAPWVAAAGLALTAVAWGVLARRYVLVRKILSQGTPIKGTAVVVDRYDMNSHSDSDTAPMQFTPTYVYYVTLRYVVEGVERKVRLRLPYSPGTYGIKEEGEVELLVLAEAPRKPLIRAVYLGGIGPSRRRRFFW